MTNTMLRRYQTTRFLDHNIPHMLSMMFYALSRHMTLMAKAIESQDYYDRHQKSEKIITSVTNLMMLLQKNAQAEDTRYLCDTITEFCHYTLRQINRITRDNDIKLCYDMVVILEKMAHFFERSIDATASP